MVEIIFLPINKKITATEGNKILAAALKNKIPIRYGCASCKCGTCAIAIKVEGVVDEMADDEKQLLTKLGLVTDGSVRLACRAKVRSGTVTVDLDFQFTYSPE